MAQAARRTDDHSATDTIAPSHDARGAEPRPLEVTERTKIGFLISPSQKLFDGEKERLDHDLVRLLSTLVYQPPHVSGITLSLRYIVSTDDSLAHKHLDIVLLVSARLDLNDPSNDDVAGLMEFRENLFNVLSLYFNPYDIRVSVVDQNSLHTYLKPFPHVRDVVEISRRVTQHAPFDVSEFKGGSTMTKIIDMMLLERGQCCYEVLLEPYRVPKRDQEEMEAYGFAPRMLPQKLDKEMQAAYQALDYQALDEWDHAGIGGPQHVSFRMKIRAFGDHEISQYLVNLVGTEISGHGDYMPVPRLSGSDLEKELASLLSLEFIPYSRHLNSSLPRVIRDLMYVFRPQEVVTAFRFPTERISVSREKMYKTFYAPITNLPKDGLLIGTSEHPSLRDRVNVQLRPQDRRRHMYLIGKTGTGKSMMLLSMLLQDINAGNGLCLIDPHGDLVEALLALMPEEREDDIYLFDPSDKDYISGLNFLETTSGSEEEQDYVVQEIISILLRTVDYDLQMYGPIAQQWTRYGCMTMMNLPPNSPLGGTLLEVPRLFSDRRFLHEVINQISSPILKQYWQDEFLNMTDFHKSEVMGYFTSKFTPLITGPQMRNVIGQIHSGFNFRAIMDSKKILLVNLASGKIGRRNSEMLGSMFVSRFLWSALGRAWMPQENRSDYYLYVDEFQNFITDSFETILSEARKYGLSLVIAHQHLGQLSAMGRMGNKLERAIFGNVGTMTVFRTGPDAYDLSRELGEPVEDSTLRNLANRLAVTKLLVNDTPTVPFTMKTLDVQQPRVEEMERGHRLKERVLRRHARPRAEVDQEIRQRYGGNLRF